ncbi:YtxH domain-containing protein [Virgibacillus sp. DJP39]|uniref:YtxH domain-containing protein n=1 Tax=Virgibacillus sp. DJP39 TaxID=3409790 RepID=UPI003BB7BA86
MQNKKMVLGIILGGIIGGLITLFDQDTRSTAKGQYQISKRQTNYYLKHPSEAIRNARVACNKFNDTFNKSADNAISALEQVEQTIDTITNKNENQNESKLKSIK